MRARALLMAAVVAVTILLPGTASGHFGLKTGRYECWLWQISMYSNFDLKIRDGGRYTFMLSDESWQRSGNFQRDGRKIKFTSGYLKKKNFKGSWDAYTNSFGHTHVVYLYKGSYDKDDLKYDCPD